MGGAIDMVCLMTSLSASFCRTTGSSDCWRAAYKQMYGEDPMSTFQHGPVGTFESAASKHQQSNANIFDFELTDFGMDALDNLRNREHTHPTGFLCDCASESSVYLIRRVPIAAS